MRKILRSGIQVDEYACVLDDQIVSLEKTAQGSHYAGVVFQKPDLDTCLTALILGVTEKERAIPTDSTPEDLLADPTILCIEAGGSGQVHLNNFDHHDPNHYFPPACRQAYDVSGIADQAMARLVDYVAMVDDGNFPPSLVTEEKVHLSHLFSGLLLSTPTIEDRFFSGITFLQTVWRLGTDPFAGCSLLPEWRPYLEAWRDNKKQLALASSAIERFRTAQGLAVGVLQHAAIGGFDLLYACGCDLAVLSSPSWGPDRVRKYTIGSRHLQLNDLLTVLLQQESGWGGRAHIIGSPRQGSLLEPETIKAIIKRFL